MVRNTITRYEIGDLTVPKYVELAVKALVIESGRSNRAERNRR